MPPQQRISVSHIYGDAWRGVKARAWLWLLSTIITAALTGISFTFDIKQSFPAPVIPSVQAAISPVAETVTVTTGLFSLDGPLAGLLLQIFLPAFIGMVMLRLTIAALEVEALGLGRATGQSLVRVLPLLLLTIIFALACGIGLMLLIIPGVIIWCCWSLSWPAMVAEGGSPWRALARSARLTKGHRWDVFFVYLIQFLLCGAGFVVLSIVMAGLQIWALDQNVLTSALFAMAGVMVIGNVLLTIISAGLAASLYVNLKRIAESTAVPSP